MIMARLEETDGYNDHHGTKNHKYTINLPLSLINEARVKCRAAGFLELAPYFRAILSREVRDGDLILSDIIGEKEIRRMGWEKVLSDRQRLEKEEYSFVKISSKSFLDKIRKLSVYFKRSKDQRFFEF